ncbi:ABC transporter substrate-binding protein [Agrobacterium sp. rho-13.3]|uniref:ABC transporter substrate-binding protein n=1 Tax=Agrobacterium sp. rho-13.3 TaxID=3072980 RepID=UPI002A128B57|nr:ABC transporter substrate-binding protein [Agrobacterium sp. rho-13.3]MDX8309098.1 ABC transporter substrate-binding protein [Agrobacterium sp. rho-13.3]
MSGLTISVGATKKTGIAKVRTATLTALFFGALAASTAHAQTFDADATINIGSLYEPQNLDNTAGAGQGINEAFNGNVYEALFRLTDSGTVEPVLSKSYEVSDDRLTYTFKLQPGIKFHSGDALTSKDVKFSIERVTAADSKSSRKNSLKTITSIETPDDETVVIKLASRSISLPYNLSYVWIVSDTATNLTSTEDGTGPYALEEWRRGSSLALSRFDGYWGQKPSNSEVVFQYFTEATALNNALLTGSVDLITSVQSPDSLRQFADNKDFTVTEGKSTTKLLLAYNDRVAPFDNVKVRKALARAVDDSKLLKAVWGDHGTLIGSMVPPTDPWYIDLTKTDAYNPESAKALLSEAGYPNGFSFTIDTPNYDPHPIAAQFLQTELAKIGVKVTINVITANEWYSKVYKAHDFQATLQEHVNHRDIVFYGNPDFYWGYNNPKVVDLIKQAEASATTDEQTAKLKEANQIVAEDAASNWIYLYPQIVVSAKTVTGYPINGLNSQFFAAGIKKAD